MFVVRSTRTVRGHRDGGVENVEVLDEFRFAQRCDVSAFFIVRTRQTGSLIVGIGETKRPAAGSKDPSNARAKTRLTTAVQDFLQR